MTQTHVAVTATDSTCGLFPSADLKDCREEGVKFETKRSRAML